MSETAFHRPEGATLAPNLIPEGEAAAMRVEELAPGVYQVLHVIPGYNALFVEQEEGDFKLSFRSQGDMDCSEIARKFSGGGHKKAAGGSILPTQIVAHSNQKPMKVMAKIGVFTFERGSAKIDAVYPGDVSPLMMKVDVPKLTMSSIGGFMKPREVFVSGEIASLSAKYKKLRVDGVTEYFGGHFGMADRDEMGKVLGITTPTLVVSGADTTRNTDVDIRKVFGALSVCGVFMAGADVAPGFPYGYEPSLKGAVLTIQTKQSKPEKYLAPIIMGEGWSNAPIKYKPLGIKPPDFEEYNRPRD